MNRSRTVVAAMIVCSLLSIGGTLADYNGCPSDDLRQQARCLPEEMDLDAFLWA